MARLLGEARVSILPDGTRFKPETEVTVKKAVAGMQAKVRVTANDDELLAKLSSAEVAIHKVIDKQYDAKFGISKAQWDLQVAKLKTEMEALSAKSVDIKTSLDLAKFDAGVAKVIAGSDAMTAHADKNAEKMAASQAKVAAAQQIAADKMAASQAKVAEAAKIAADKEAAAWTKAAAESAAAQEAAFARIRKARDIDTKNEQAKIADTVRMYDKLFQAVDKDAAAWSKASADSEAAQGASLARIHKAREADLKDEQSKINATVRMYDKLFQDIDKGAKVTPRVEPGKALAEAGSLREKMKVILGDIKAKVKVDNDSLKQAGGAITGFFAGKVENVIGKAGDNGGKKFGGGFISGLGKSALMQNPGITAAVIAGLAALPAAVGAVGVLGGLALGAGLVFGAQKLVQAELKNVGAVATKQLAVTKTQNTIAGLTAASRVKPLTPSQKTSLANAQASLPVQQQALTVAKGNTAGINFQQLQAYNNAFQGLQAGVGRLKKSFLDFAITAGKPLLKPFTNALDYLGSQLRGPLKSAFTDMFKAVTPLIKPVEESLLLIVKGVLPGLTFMLDKARKPLSELFINFGKIVGLRLGDWFRAATPYIKDSATYFNKLIDILGKTGTWLIRFGGETAKAFGGSQFKGFGKLIKEIGDDLLKLLIPAFTGWTAVMAPVLQILLEILVPILNFLAKNPALVKTLAGLAAAWLLVGKAVEIAAIAMKIFGISSETILAASPWIALAAAIVIAVILIIKHWKPISAFFVKIWKDIWSGFIGPVINFFTKTIPHAFSVTLDWLKRNWPLLVGIIGGPFAEIAGVVYKYHTQIFNVIKSVWGHIENFFTGIGKPIGSVVNGVWTQITRITKAAWKIIVDVIRIPVLIILGIIGEAVIGIRNLFNLVWPYIYRFTKATWGHIENAITGVVKPLVGWIRGAWTQLARYSADAWNTVFNDAKTIWGHIENAITGIVKPLVNWVRGAWDTLAKWSAAAWNVIFSDTKTIWGHIENAITGIVKPIMSNISGAWSNIKNWTRDAWNVVHDDIVSPLNKAWGWVANHFVKGIKDAFSGLVSTVKSIWAGLKKAVAEPVNFVITSIWNPFAGFVNKGLSIFGIKSQLPTGKAIKFATGGHVPGYAPGQDTVSAMLSPGEYVLNPKAVKAIGKGNLDAVNFGVHPQTQRFAGGGGVQGNQQLLMDAEKYKGHKYIWGGASNPTTGWDCSSFVGYVLGHDFGRPLPGGVKWNPNSHGPVASQYNNTPGFHLVSHHTSDIQPGDLLVENSGGHVGFGAGPNAMFSAFGTNFGTLLTNANNMTNIYRNTGALSSNGPLSFVGGILKAAAQVALNGIEGLLGGALNKVPGKGPLHDLPIAVVKKVFGSASNALNNNSNNYVQSGGIGGIPGGNPPGGSTGADYANAIEGYKYLKQNLFGGNKLAAAGAVASIDGESGWNPYAVGTGGRGLIGWTPPGSISDAAFKGGMRTQLPAIIDFVRKNNDGSTIAAMERAGSLNQAAQLWDHGVERAGINDVHAYGLNLASGIAGKYAGGGMVQKFATGGLVAQSTIDAKIAQIAKVKNKISQLAHTKHRTATQNTSLKNDEIDLALWNKELGGYLHTNSAAATARAVAARQAAASKAAAKAAAAKAAKASKADAARIAKLELKPLTTLRSLASHYKAKMTHDAKTGNARDYLGSSYALDDVNAAIAGWKSPLQREHDMDAAMFHKYSTAAAKDKRAGNAKAFLRDSVKADKYAAAIASVNKKMAAPTLPTNVFTPINIPYVSDFSQNFGTQMFSQGGWINEPVRGVGMKTGMPYSFAERGPEKITPATVQNTGNGNSEQLLLALLAEMRTANQINKVTAQNTGTASKSLGNVGRHIL